MDIPQNQTGNSKQYPLEKLSNKLQRPVAVKFSQEDDGSPRLSLIDDGVIDMRGEFTQDRLLAALTTSPEKVKKRAIAFLSELEHDPWKYIAAMSAVTSILEAEYQQRSFAG